MEQQGLMLYLHLSEIGAEVEQEGVELNRGYVVHRIENSEIKELVEIFRSRLEDMKDNDQGAELGVKVVQEELGGDLVPWKK